MYVFGRKGRNLHAEFTLLTSFSKAWRSPTIARQETVSLIAPEDIGNQNALPSIDAAQQQNTFNLESLHDNSAETLMARYESLEEQTWIERQAHHQTLDLGSIRRLRETYRAHAHDEDDWFAIPFKYLSLYDDVSPVTFFTEDQPAVQGD